MRNIYYITLAAGLWLIITPFFLNFGPLLDMPGPAASEGLVLGILVCGLSMVALMGGLYARGLDWLLLLFGIWIILDPMLYGGWTFNSAEMTNTAIAGAAIIFIALLELFSVSRREPRDA
ncbi:MAG TPA: hypothetical protein VIC33_05590 [Vicinamibacterales bacterium]|jgi:hypothetical protein